MYALIEVKFNCLVKIFFRIFISDYIQLEDGKPLLKSQNNVKYKKYI